MKVPASIRQLYQKAFDEYEPLKKRVDELMAGVKQGKWHYESRLKSATDFALKLETGRYPTGQIDDFFGCMIVVENQRVVREAEALVREHLDVFERRPPFAEKADSAASDFRYNDLRLYARWRSAPGDSLAPDTRKLPFEVQIKTFLQHAWAVATHDTMYKGAHVRWAIERVYFSVRAVLESVEMAIHAAPALAEIDILQKVGRDEERLIQTLDLLACGWSEAALPVDKIRLARNVMALSDAAKISVSEIGEALAQETAEGRGGATLSLSPFGVVIETLIRRFPSRFKEFLARTPREGGFRVAISEELVEQFPEVAGQPSVLLFRAKP